MLYKYYISLTFTTLLMYSWLEILNYNDLLLLLLVIIIIYYNNVLLHLKHF